MNKNTGALLRDIRNIKSNTSMFPSPQDIITSAKQLKRIKSTQQINVNTFMDNKNQKIKNIDQKLQVHQNQINKNNQIIEQLTNNFISMKDQMIKQKQKTLAQEKKNKLLKEEIERTNKLLRSKTLKADELAKKVQIQEKEIESNKAIILKNQQLTNSLIKVRGQIANAQQTLSETKIKLQEREKQIIRQKEKLGQVDYLQSKISQLQAQLSAKDSIINNYKITIHEFTAEKDKDISKKLILQADIEKIKAEMDELRKAKISTEKAYQMSQKRFQQTSKKLQKLECQRDVAQSKMKSHESEQSRVRILYQQINKKNEQLIQVHNSKMQEFNMMASKLQKGQQKVKDLQIQLGQARDQKNKLQNVQITFNQLKKRSKNLQTVYNSIVPQIQCPFGHELCNPVTIIPCGHNYCLGCKKGYQKQCSQCKGKLKIQAVYRNELMDDIIGIIGSVKVVVELFRQK